MKFFKSRFSEQEATTLLELLETKQEQKYQEKKDVLANKEDIGHLRKEIAVSKSDLIKWMFIFWIGQIAAMIGLVVLYIKK